MHFSLPFPRNLPLLKEIDGRVCEFIEGTNKNKVHGEFFTHIFDGLRISEKYQIKEFRIIQEKIDKMRIEFVTEEDLSKKDVKIIRNKVNKYLGEMEIEIKKVKFIPMTKRGKKMFVIFMLNRHCVKSQPTNSPLDTVFYCKYFKESRQQHILSYLVIHSMSD